MKERDKVTVEGEVSAIYPEWVMVKFPSVRGAEYARVPKRAVKPVKAPEPKAAK